MSARNRELLALIPASLLVTAGFAAIFIERSKVLSDASLTYGGMFLALCVLTHVASGRADPIDHRFHALLVTSLQGTTARDGKVGADVRGADLGPAEIDRQDRPVGYLIHRPSL